MLIQLALDFLLPVLDLIYGLRILAFKDFVVRATFSVFVTQLCKKLFTIVFNVYISFLCTTSVFPGINDRIFHILFIILVPNVFHDTYPFIT